VKQATGYQQEKNRNWQHENQSRQRRENKADVWQGGTLGANHGSDDNGELYARTGEIVMKVDSCAFFAGLRPGTASRVWDWYRHMWLAPEMAVKNMQQRIQERSVLIYEVQLSSWQFNENGSFLSS